MQNDEATKKKTGSLFRVPTLIFTAFGLTCFKNFDKDWVKLNLYRSLERPAVWRKMQKVGRLDIQFEAERKKFIKKSRYSS